MVVDGLADEDRGGEDYFRLTTGLDYSLTGTTYGFVEYHYNGVGTNHAEDYLAVLSHPAYRDGSVYLLGRHYLIPGLTHQITPLLTGNVMALVNLGDPSASIVPSLEYNVATDIYLSAGAYIGVGEEP